MMELIVSDEGARLYAMELADRIPCSHVWRPIETAPRNEWVLLYLPRKMTMTEGRLFTLSYGGVIWEDGDGNEFEPSHWMIRPEPPK